MRSHVDDRGSGAGARPYAQLLRAHLGRLTRHGVAGQLAERTDPAVVETVTRYLQPFYEHYFRADVRGLSQVPDEPTMLVGNHDGGYIAADGLCLGYAWHHHHGFKRPLIVLMHDFPFRISAGLTDLLSKCGIRPANRHELGRAIEQRDSLMVYPGGAYEAFRTFFQRQRIDLGHRTGFVREALERRVPISPVVSVGAHETLFVLSRGAWLARRIPLIRGKFRSDVLPLWLGLPWGVGWGPLPHLPLPAKITVEVLPPVRLWKELGEAADPSDPRVLLAGLDLVRDRLQRGLDRLYAERRWPIIG